MRPTEAQHRAALALHAGRTERFVRGELTPDEWRPIRLSYGLYYQLDHTSHMQRIKIAGGMLTGEQMEAMAEVADRYGRGIGHVTTRQDIQIHWVPIEGIIDLYERLLAAGITTRGACADSVRNVTACPFAGTAPSEPFDVSPYCIAIHEYFLFNPLNLTLPRKFKIAIEGCEHDCAQAPANDIGLYAKARDGARGFSLHAGGGLGAQPFLAKPMLDFVPAEDVLVWCEAIVRRRPGYRAGVVQGPLGDITADQMRAVARLAREHGNGTIRTTNDQNLVLQWIPEAALPALHAELVAIELANPDVSSINDVVSCPGMDYCSLAITRSMGMAERIHAHLGAHPESRNGFAERLGPFTVKISGCPNSCGQHHVGDIGLTGHLAKTPDGGERPFYSILVGGAVGEGKARIGKRLGRFAEEDTAAAIAGIARVYERERQAGESFPAFVDRVGEKRLAAIATAAKATGPPA